MGLVVQAGALASGHGTHRTTFPRKDRGGESGVLEDQTLRNTRDGWLAEGAAPGAFLRPPWAGPGPTTVAVGARPLEVAGTVWKSWVLTCHLWVLADTNKDQW